MTLDRRKAVLGRMRAALLALGVLAAAATPTAAVGETYMTVSDVPIDVTAKSAAAARDQAIADVQTKAFQRLVKRLVPKQEDQAKLQPTRDQIESFVQDFAVESERTSSVRYIGRYSVRFRENAVRRYLADSGVDGVAEVQQVLLLPVYKGANGSVLWGPANSWRTAWDQGGYGDGPVSLILPNGDAYDTGYASAVGIDSGDMAAIVPLIQRYRTAGVVVAEAVPRDPAKGPLSGLTVTVSSFDLTGLKGTQTIAVEADKNEQPSKMLGRAVALTAAALENGWQQAIAGGGGTGLVGVAPADAASSDAQQPAAAEAAGTLGTLYPMAVQISDLGDWARTRDQLTALPGVQRLSLDAVTRSSAAFTLDFAGDPIALQTVLAGSGYVLVQTAAGGASGPGAFELKRAAPIGGPGQAQAPAPAVPPSPGQAAPAPAQTAGK